MNQQEKLVEILRHKGIGPEGSKSLKESDLSFLNTAFKDQNTSLITRATLLTALLTLPPNPLEKVWLSDLKRTPSTFLPEELLPFIEPVKQDHFQTLINRVISQEDINEDAASAISYCFDTDMPAYKKAAFLEGMRLKRETYIENKIFYTFFKKLSIQKQTDLPLIVDLCDSYDGVVRHHNYGLFSACILAALKIPVVIHGLDQVAPKKGITHAQILSSAGKTNSKTIESAYKDLSNPSIGWTYIDQSVYFKALYEFKDLREKMVKRPFIATFEKLLQPIRAKEGNFIVSSYTHKHYRMEVIELLKEAGEVNQVIHYKGSEATTQPNPARAFDYLLLKDNTIQEQQIDPKDYKVEGRGPILHKEGIDIKDIVTLGEGVLKGEKNEAYRFIVFQCAIILENLGWTSTDILKQIEEVLENGKAYEAWKNGAIE